MNPTESGKESVFKRFVRDWRFPAAMVAVLVLAAAYWLLPRRTIDVISVDGAHRWDEAFAPPKRQIVWEPAHVLGVHLDDLGLEGSLIRPQLADDQRTLYFTLQKGDGDADIYRARLQDGRWQAAEPVAELNTPNDDIGPILSHDETQLYLYSNRAGGLGGFDLYSARRTAEGWSTPVNLGPQINTRANEYDPALSSDGTQLFFASNRTARMQELAQASQEEREREWKATLRAQEGLQHFDLFVARRTSAEEPWTAPVRLEGVNRPDANEGAPYVAPSGLFLYFASDRPHRQGELRNYDLYRGRLEGNRLVDIENLGSGVNTAANETEPALALRGFYLVFSSDRALDKEVPAESGRYTLYDSTSTEIVEMPAWKRTQVPGLGLLWWLLLALLLLALLAAILWYLREISLRRVPVPGFLVIALLVHVLLGISSFFVYFGGDIVAEIRKEFREIVVAGHMSNQNLHQSHEAGQEAYEKVADLQSVETVRPAEVVRQVTEVPNVPVRTDSPIMKVPLRMTRTVPQEREIVTLPKAETNLREKPDLTRRVTPLERIEVAQVEIETTEAEQRQSLSAIERVEVDLTRRQPTPKSTRVPPLVRRTMRDPAMQIEREVVEVERSDQHPNETPQARIELARANRQAAPQTEVPQIQSEEVTPPSQRTAESSPQSTPVDLARRQPPNQVAQAPSMLRRTSPTTKMKLSRIDLQAEKVDQRPARAATDTPTQLARAEQVTPDAPAAPQVAPQQLVVAASSPNPDAPPTRAAVEIDRQTPLSQAVRVPTLARKMTAPSELQLAQAEITVERAADQPLRADTTSRPALPERATQAPLERDVTQVATEDLGAPQATPQSDQAPERATVSLDRQQALLVARLPSAMQRPTSIESGVKLAASNITVQRVNDQPAETSTNDPPVALERTTQTVADSTGAPQVAAEELVAAATDDDEDEDMRPERIQLEIDRLATSANLSAVPAIPHRDTLARSLRAAVRQEITPQRNETPVEIEASRQQVSLARADTAIVAAGADPQITREDVVAAGDPAVVPAAVAAAEVKFDRVATTVPMQEPVSLASTGPVGRTIDEQAQQRPAAMTLKAEPVASRVSPELEAARLVEAAAAAEPIATEETGEGTPAATLATPAGLEVAIARTDAPSLAVPFETTEEFSGRHNRRNPQLVIGSLEKQAVDAPPSASSLASQIVRRPARAPVLLYAEDNIGLQAMFRLRQGEAKREVVAAFGGNDATLEAVRRGLVWIERHQHDDGHWSLNNFYCQCKDGRCSGHGGAASDPAATGFALLPFLGDGHTHLTGPYQETIKKGIDWLVGHQLENGDLTKGAGGNTRMYSHGIATIALCEAYAMSKDSGLREPAQKAIDFIISAQHQPSGGWRYNPNQSADTSVVGWQVMALKSGQMAGLEIPAASLELVKKWLHSVEGKGKQIGTFGYTSPSPSPAMSAEGLLCLQYLGTRREDPRMQSGADYLLTHLPAPGKDNSYYWYYGTQVMFHMQGDYWHQWNDSLRDMLVESQVKDGSMAGTWDPRDNYEKTGGRIYSTAMRLLMLEVYYRHLPLYQVLDQ